MPETYNITSSESGTNEASPNPKVELAARRYADTNVGSLLARETFETAATDSSLENHLNAERMHRLKSNFSRRFLQLVREQDFEYGFDSPADELVRKCLHENRLATKEWLNDLFIQNFGVEAVIIGILQVFSHLDYQEASPEGPTMALAALSNMSAEVRECGIRAFENWGTLQSLEVLRKVSCPEKWLDDYLKQVITGLKKELAGNVAVG